MKTKLDNPREIIDFWFSDQVRPYWFNATTEFDLSLSDKYLDIYNAAMQNKLKTWEDSALSILALVIVLDQFPLNMFRGIARCYDSGDNAIKAASTALEKKFDNQLTDPQKSFLYMPFMHSENINDQNKSVELYKNAGLEQNLKFAIHHRDIVQKFGRFPHRNELLNRQNSTEEIDYLNSDKAFKG